MDPVTTASTAKTIPANKKGRYQYSNDLSLLPTLKKTSLAYTKIPSTAIIVNIKLNSIRIIAINIFPTGREFLFGNNVIIQEQ
jgi:hypothetical protein